MCNNSITGGAGAAFNTTNRWESILAIITPLHNTYTLVIMLVIDIVAERVHRLYLYLEVFNCIWILIKAHIRILRTIDVPWGTKLFSSSWQCSHKHETEQGRDRSCWTYTRSKIRVRHGPSQTVSFSLSTLPPFYSPPCPCVKPQHQTGKNVFNMNCSKVELFALFLSLYTKWLCFKHDRPQ